MKKMLFLLSCKIGVLLLVIYGCQDTMVVEMSKEQRLYSSKCSSCHSLIAPQRHSKDEWIYYVDKYGQKLKLTNKEKQIILEYLTK